jgi:hypothetical protein
LARLASVRGRSGARNASLIAGAAGLIAEKSFAPYSIAGAITLLLFAGDYGAWDLTLWIVRNRTRHSNMMTHSAASCRRLVSSVEWNNIVLDGLYVLNPKLVRRSARRS